MRTLLPTVGKVGEGEMGYGPDLSYRCLHSCLPAVLFVAIPDDWCHAGGWHLVHEAARWQTVIVSCFARYDSMTFLCKETLFDGSLCTRATSTNLLYTCA